MPNKFAMTFLYVNKISVCVCLLIILFVLKLIWTSVLPPPPPPHPTLPPPPKVWISPLMPRLLSTDSIHTVNPYAAGAVYIRFNPLSSYDALKHNSASVKNDLISWNYNENFHAIVLKISVYFFICHSLQVIFICYKLRIAAAIRGL